ARGADNLRAALAIGLEAVLADQRADPRCLLLDRIERVDAGEPGVEFGSGIAIELCQRTLRGGIPVAVGGAVQTADAAQFGLHRLRDLSLRRRRRIEGSHVHGLVSASLVGGGLVGRGAFGGGALLLGRSGLLLRDLLGLLGRKTRLLGGFRVSL